MLKLVFFVFINITPCIDRNSPGQRLIWRRVKISDKRSKLWFFVRAGSRHSGNPAIEAAKFHAAPTVHNKEVSSERCRYKSEEIWNNGEKRQMGRVWNSLVDMCWRGGWGGCCVWAASVCFCLRPKLTILADKPLVGRSVCLCPLSRGHWEEQQRRGEKGL